MNNGKGIVELVQELQRRQNEKADFLVNPAEMKMEVSEDREVTLDIPTQEPLNITDNTHRQIGAWAKIPANYYSRMQEEAPELLANNVNHWMEQKTGVKRMVRTLDGNARAFLSNRYRRIDNEQIAEAVLPVLLGSDQVEVKSTDVTDTRMYIKALFPKVEGEVKKGDVVRSGVMITNSEIGLGSLNIQPFVYRLVCTNGMVSQSGVDFGFNRSHVGRKWDIGDAVEIFRDETIMADDKAMMLKIADVVRASMNPKIFAELLAKMQGAAMTEKLVSPMVSVERLGSAYGLRENEKTSILENLIRGQDYTQWGALNAVTELANTTKSYDRSTDLETIGGKILDLSPKDWHEVAFYEEAEAA